MRLGDADLEEADGEKRDEVDRVAVAQAVWLSARLVTRGRAETAFRSAPACQFRERRHDWRRDTKASQEERRVEVRLLRPSKSIRHFRAQEKTRTHDRLAHSEICSELVCDESVHRAG